MLMARNYEVLPLFCPRCGAPMRNIALVTEWRAVQRILDHLGEPSQPPRLAPAARGPPLTEADVAHPSRDAPPQGESLPEYELDQRVSW